MAGAEQRDRWRRGARLGSIFPPAALAAVLLALAAGASRARWLPVGMFLALAVVADAYFWLGWRAERRRAWRLRQMEVAFGIRHDEPLWMAMLVSSMAVVFGAIGGAIPSALGFPSVGVGVLLMFLAMAATMSFLKLRMTPRGLTFERRGLRIHVGGGSFVVPWMAIAGVTRVGPDHMQIIELRLTDAAEVIASHEPKNEKIRSRVESVVEKRADNGGKVMLMPGTGGLDGVTIARTIEAAMGGKAERAN